MFRTMYVFLQPNSCKNRESLTKNTNNMSKVVKGSALIDDYGGVTFTPYDSNPAENSPWVVLATSSNGKLQCTKKKVNLVITINRPAEIQEVISVLQRQAALLVSELIKASVQRKYIKTEGK